MSSHPISRRSGSALAIALAGLALAPPATIARLIDEPVLRANAQPRVTLVPAPGVSSLTSQQPRVTPALVPAPGASSLTSQQVLASRGAGAPRPVVRTADRVTDPGFAWDSAAIGAAGAAVLIALGSLGVAAVGRGRLRVAR